MAESNPTDRLPQYWLHGQPPGVPPHRASPGGESPPPERPKSPRWLWIAAGAAVLLVTALLIALVIANGTAKKQTAVAPLPAMPRSSSPKSASSTTSGPSNTSSPSGTSSETTSAAGAQTVVYNVTGQGRAISITYVDDGGVKQTEFNVVLPWSKEVSLSSAQNTASITIVNIGHDVTCTVTVGGVQVRQHTGVGLTTCDAAS